MIISFAESYGKCLSGPVPRSRLGSTEPSAIRWLSACHLSVARPMLRMYSKWELENLEKLAASVAGSGLTTRVPKAGSKHGADLSRSEEVRILRALYRYDTFCHLFGTNTSELWLSLFYEYEVNEMFLGLFEPWEVEAIVCIDAFLWQRYDQIFDEIQDDLHENNPKFYDEDSGSNLSDSRDLSRTDTGNGGMRDCTISRGLKTAVRILAIDDHDTLAFKTSRVIVGDQCEDPPAKDCLSSLGQIQRRDHSAKYPNHKDEAEQRRDPMEFTGDTVPPDAPPMAWVLLWDGKYANVYDDFVPAGLKECGYVMWDARRLDEAGLEEAIFKQWEGATDQIARVESVCGWNPTGVPMDPELSRQYAEARRLRREIWPPVRIVSDGESQK
ncbi:hypothetical protein CSOJ01_10198 [Colletotrichum sojae]|uniref:Uncharacterized protein n=1 Tax=Colletotrichum sojae TaxID=2175907 RepID=A0A8H6MPI1_9PEZI|nr:hypothetical protein CSOJ01_10198 [Colletotrichum sojae]